MGGGKGYIRRKCPFSCIFVFLAFHLPSNLFAARGEGGPQTNWKASGRFLFVWLRRRWRPRYTVQIVVFVGGPLLKWSRRPHGVFGREGNVIFAFKMVETEQPPPFSKRRRRQLTNGMFSRRLQPFSNRRRRRRRLTVLNATVVTSRTDVGLLKI